MSDPWCMSCYIVRVSVGWWCSAVHVRLLVIVVLHTEGEWG